ncbi:hypothetical protein LCGC14_1500630 [marine sediment metagenome]|uniref:Uncharacterized protein n=1 Tax=marine sediment metagenome TaxID=412755 RepID=A0A0F9J457_9ZZZZ
MSLEDIERKLDQLLSFRSAKLGERVVATILQNATVGLAADVGDNFPYLLVEIPSLDSADISLQVAHELDGTYQDLSDAVYAAGTGAKNNTFKLAGWRYIKFKVSVSQTTADRRFIVRGASF